MDAPIEPFYKRDESETMADVREAMSRRGDFDPTPERYANESHYLEVIAVLEALLNEGEVLA
jgi:hypothetical protein